MRSKEEILNDYVNGYRGFVRASGDCYFGDKVPCEKPLKGWGSVYNIRLNPTTREVGFTVAIGSQAYIAMRMSPSEAAAVCQQLLDAVCEDDALVPTIVIDPTEEAQTPE